jgi:hypothetical protein
MHCAAQILSLVRTTRASRCVDPAARIRPKSSVAARLYTLSHAPSLEQLPPILVRFRQTKKYPLVFSFPHPRGTSLKRRLSVYAREGADTIAYPPITNIITTFSVFFTGCRMLNKVPVAADVAVLLNHGLIAALFFVCAEQCGI